MVKIRTGAWRIYTRSRTLAQATASTREIHRCAASLLATWRRDHPHEGIRLLGVGVSGLEHAGQAALFDAG